MIHSKLLVTKLMADLYENKNLGQVVASIFALSRHAQKHGFNGPLLGPKLADKHVITDLYRKCNSLYLVADKGSAAE
jgi:hypothetical protein